MKNVVIYTIMAFFLLLVAKDKCYINNTSAQLNYNSSISPLNKLVDNQLSIQKQVKYLDTFSMEIDEDDLQNSITIKFTAQFVSILSLIFFYGLGYFKSPQTFSFEYFLEFLFLKKFLLIRSIKI